MKAERDILFEVDEWVAATRNTLLHTKNPDLRAKGKFIEACDVCSDWHSLTVAGERRWKIISACLLSEVPEYCASGLLCSMHSGKPDPSLAQHCNPTAQQVFARTAGRPIDGCNCRIRAQAALTVPLARTSARSLLHEANISGDGSIDGSVGLKADEPDWHIELEGRGP